MRYWLITYTWKLLNSERQYKTEGVATPPVEWLVAKKTAYPNVALLLVSPLTEMEYSELNR